MWRFLGIVVSFMKHKTLPLERAGSWSIAMNLSFDIWKRGTRTRSNTGSCNGCCGECTNVSVVYQVVRVIVPHQLLLVLQFVSICLLVPSSQAINSIEKQGP